jgi:hypothetical protein
MMFSFQDGYSTSMGINDRSPDKGKLAEGRRQKAEGRRQKAKGKRQKADGCFTTSQLEGLVILYAENTARASLNNLCDINVLEKRTIDGHYYYLNLELYRMLSE